MPKPLTSESLKKLLAAFSPDEEAAAIAYTDLRDSLIRYFQLKGVSLPAKAADETIDRVAEKINQDIKIEDIVGYTFSTAKFIYLEVFRTSQIENRAAAQFYQDIEANKSTGELNHLELLRECFNSLYEDEQKLLLNYFADLPSSKLSKNRQKMADREKIDLNALRNRVSRLRRRLEDCVGKKK